MTEMEEKIKKRAELVQVIKDSQQQRATYKLGNEILAEKLPEKRKKK